MTLWRRRLGFSVLTTLIFFALLEGAASAVWGAPHGQGRVITVADQEPGLQDLGDGSVQPDWQGQVPVAPFARVPSGPRVVVMGGSSVHEGTQQLVTSAGEFASLLDQRLPAEVLNLGGPGLDSDDHVRIADAVWPLGVDVAVLYFGHNDFGNPVFSERYSRPGQRVLALLQPVTRRSMFVEQLRRLADLRVYDRTTFDGERQQRSLEHLRQNLERLVGLASHLDVSLVLVTPVSNLFFEPYDDCTDPDCPRPRLVRARELYRRNPVNGLAELRALRDTDPSQQRAPTEAQQLMRDIAHQHGLPLVDAERTLPGTGSGPDTRTPRGGLFLDNLHFAPQGHEAMARLLLPVLRAALAQRHDSTSTKASSSSSSESQAVSN